MSRRDEEDWVGTPPEGRHSADQADPAHWARQRTPQAIVFGILFLLVVVVVLLAVLR